MILRDFGITILILLAIALIVGGAVIVGNTSCQKGSPSCVGDVQK
jgi:hypothetical protein